MATLGELKHALKAAAPSVKRERLSESQYETGFDLLLTGTTVYEDFIHPEVCRQLTDGPRGPISVLEIGPGPRTVLAALPEVLRRNITQYVAFEPNHTYASSLEESLLCREGAASPLPCLDGAATIYKKPFFLGNNHDDVSIEQSHGAFDIILFCHSMYGMSPKRSYIEKALHLLKKSDGAKVIVFHRNESLNFDGLVCQHTASFPKGVVHVPDLDNSLDSFASFVAGEILPLSEEGNFAQQEWRKICRELSQRSQSGGHVFSSPELMVTFTHGSLELEEIVAKVPTVKLDKIKNPEARHRRPASIVKPAGICQVQGCVQWAIKHGLTLAVLGGSHGAHCIVDNVVSVDMSCFDQISIHRSTESPGPDSDTLVIVGSGCKAGDIVHRTMEHGLTVPLGSRPSVGAGLWLQGGIGHLSRYRGLTCDTIVGAVLVSVDDARVVVVGEVPDDHLPQNAVRPENEAEVLWAIRGAGTDFGVVTNVVFKAFPVETFLTTNWKLPLNDEVEAQGKIDAVNKTAATLYTRDSVDMYLYWDGMRLSLGVSLYGAASPGLTFEAMTPTTMCLRSLLGTETKSETCDGIQLFESEMYMSGMHGGHGGGKTSAFKRCVFLRDIGTPEVVNALLTAMQTRSSPLCYLHLLQGGGAIADVKSDATAFGCRDWDYACVITGVWKRDQDGTAAARAAVEWVYRVVGDLLPLSSGIYGADLGRDPRDADLAAHALGPNRLRLGRLKWKMDPHRVLAHACPLPQKPRGPRLIILVTGSHGAGKDYCAAAWNDELDGDQHIVHVASISDMTKKEYAASVGASYERLLTDREYKEKHRPALTAFYDRQVAERPNLPEQHFLQVVHEHSDADVLLITGMRDKSPVATFSYLVPYSRVLEARLGLALGFTQTITHPRHRQRHAPPDFIFDNDTQGSEEAKKFASHFLLPLLQTDLTHLADMVRSTPNHPRSGVNFHHILGIAQHPDGLALCTSLLRDLFSTSWPKIDTIACCESGGFIFASALATNLNLPLALIRKAGKLPPPTFSVGKESSYISSLSGTAEGEETFEMEKGAVAKGSEVVVVDDVLSSGKTVWAVLQLLRKAGVRPADVTVMVVAELPGHRGREFLRMSGFGEVSVRSLFVYGGA